jgi:hypothetical protein
MDGVSAAANTRAALNAGDGQQPGGLNALKIAAEAEKAVVKVVEETARAAPPEGQGRRVDKIA